jgi:hypothetical protein
MKSRVDALLHELVEGQQKRLLRLGRQFIPTLTPEDILQPNDYPALDNDPSFRYEEGVLAGIQATQMALRALFNEEAEIDS